jgi:hypothetical protein
MRGEVSSGVGSCRLVEKTCATIKRPSRVSRKSRVFVFEVEANTIPVIEKFLAGVVLSVVLSIRPLGLSSTVSEILR